MKTFSTKPLTVKSYVHSIKLEIVHRVIALSESHPPTQKRMEPETRSSTYTEDFFFSHGKESLL